MSAETPRALALADLKRSGLTAADARRLRFEVLAPTATARLDPAFKAAAALKIPYFDLAGQPTKFYRLRYLELNGFDALARKPLRYTQPTGSAPEVYFPPLGGFDWRALATATDRSLLITEGEKKAAAATKAGFPTIGLGGVWSWRSKRLGLGLLHVLRDAIRWADRTVYLVFDSDLATNPDVSRALTALATELGALGAKPHVAALPAEDEAKVGLDDFLVANGPTALAKLLKAAEPFSLLEELWRLNGEVVYIRDPGLIVVLGDGRKVAARAFKEHAFANRYYYERAVDAKGLERLTKKPVAPAWLGWERRAELARITYAPGEPRVTARAAYNYWPGWGADPAPGSVALWTELLDYLFEGADDARRWFERWCAYPIRYPGAKLYAAAVIWGTKQGTGKSLIGYSLFQVYGRNATEIDDQHLASPYNEWAENRQFVMADDVTSGEHKRALADRLKGMITRRELRLNPKYVPSYVVPDVINYYFTSNHPDAFFLEDEDRRYFVHEAPPETQPLEFYQRYDRWLSSGVLGPALHHHLRTLKLDGFDPKAPAFVTAAKLAMTADGRSDLGDWVARLREAPDAVLRLGEVKLTGDLFTNAQLLRLYDPASEKRVTANGLGRELKRAGFRQVNGGSVVLTAATGPQRLYAIRNAKRWSKARVEDVKRAYDDAHRVQGAPADLALPPPKEKRP